jgi:hypothetical protein
MPELMQFRLARAPQKQTVDPNVRLPLHIPSEITPGPEFDNIVLRAIQNPNSFDIGFQVPETRIFILGKLANLQSPIGKLERWLTSRNNSPEHNELCAQLSALTKEAGGNIADLDPNDLGVIARFLIDTVSDTWLYDRENVGLSLLVAMLRDPEPSRAVYLNRLMLVFGLVELAAENPNRLKTADDIRWALNSRTVILPPIFVNFHRRGNRWLEQWANNRRFVTKVGDFNGNGRDDIAAFRPGNGSWYVALSDGTRFVPYAGGQPIGGMDQSWLTGFADGSFVTMVGDFDGDGKDDIAAFSPSNGRWYVALSDGTRFVPYAGGQPAAGADAYWLDGWASENFVTVVGDFNGDGKDDLAAFQFSIGRWYVALSDGTRFVPYAGGRPAAGADAYWLDGWAKGRSSVVLVGDFNGDGKDDIAVYKPDTGIWQIALSDGTQFIPSNAFSLGTWVTGSCWVPLVGDFNGDGIDDLALWNPRTGEWQVALSDGEKFVIRPDRSLLARRPGVADLYVVREEWSKYVPGEIAHIENVMASETRERSHTHITETEQTTTIDQETSKSEQRDNQTTDRFDLNQQSSSDSRLNIHVDGSVDTSGQYGPTKVNTHLGGSLDYALNQSQSQATTTAHETVARAVVSVEQRVREIRTTRSLERFEELNKHAFTNNASDAKHISGIYRWADKLKRVQIFRYPHRFILEFQIPEPGAWLRWLLDQKQPKAFSENPIPFTKDGTTATAELTFADISEDKYALIAARYKTLGIKPPPANTVTIATNLTLDAEKNPTQRANPIPPQQVKFLVENRLTVPLGYEAATWIANVQTVPSYFERGDFIDVQVAVGSGSPVNYQPRELNTTNINGTVGGISVGSIPIIAMISGSYGFNASVVVECKRLEETETQWKIDTYNQIAQAYYAMKNQYDNEVAAQGVRNGVSIEGQSPVLNAEMIRVELKKSVIEMLTGANFSGRNAIQRLDSNGNPIQPKINLQQAIKDAPEIQFLEQSFEWENLTYVLYPYYWTGKDQWDKLADLSSSDTDFANFLKAGSARVIVSARTKFEKAVWWYVNFGLLWGGGQPPAPDDEDYLSIAEEVRAMEQAPRDGIAGESWEVRLPTTLVWLDTVRSSLPVEIDKHTLDEPPGKTLP